MTTTTTEMRGLAWVAALATRLHPFLIVTLVALRPLIWDGEPGGPDRAAYALAVIVGLLAMTIESLAGIRTHWRIGQAGIAFAVLVAWLAPAALRSPQHALGMLTWCDLVVHLGLACYLSQVVAGRERLVVAALAAGLAAEATMAVAQKWWVLPALAARQRAGTEPLLAADPHGDVAARIAGGGVYGTFTLSNSLAGYLLLTVPPLAAMAWWARGAQRIALGSLVVVSAWVFLATKSKGADVALAAAAAATLALALRGRARAAVVVAGVAALALALATPAVRHVFAASAAVRWGYWQGALRLCGEAPLFGQGIGGFATGFARVMPLDCEPTRLVHDEPLEAAVDGGVIAGALLVWALIACLRRPPQLLDVPAGRSDRWAVALLPAMALYVHLLGAYDVSLFPSGSGFIGDALWMTAVAGVMGFVGWILLSAPMPPPWALRLALIAFAAHTLVDFDLHAGGAVGTLIALACLAGTRRAIAVTRDRSALAMIAVAMLLGLEVWSLVRGSELRRARDIVSQVRATSQPPTGSHDPLRGLAWMLDVPPPASPDDRRRLIAAALDEADRLAWRAPHGDGDACLMTVPMRLAGADRLPFSRRAAESFPQSGMAHALLAEDEDVAGDHASAARELRFAVACAPAYLPYRRRLAQALRAQAITQPQLATELRAEAVTIDAEVRRLDPIVHYRNR